jgi:hypothetical protein
MPITHTNKGPVFCGDYAHGSIASSSDFLDAMGSSPVDTLVFQRYHFPEAFFELKTGLAGEILQKASNYRRRLVILGNFADLPSKSLRDFIYESNKTGQVVFAPDLDRALELLKCR